MSLRSTSWYVEALIFFSSSSIEPGPEDKNKFTHHKTFPILLFLLCSSSKTFPVALWKQFRLNCNSATKSCIHQKFANCQNLFANEPCTILSSVSCVLLSVCRSKPPVNSLNNLFLSFWLYSLTSSNGFHRLMFCLSFMLFSLAYQVLPCIVVLTWLYVFPIVEGLSITTLFKNELCNITY